MANLLKLLKDQHLDPDRVVCVYDIGCIGNMADFVDTRFIHSLHGRCIPTAVGIKLANPKLTVFAIGGDGGVYGEGVGHLVAAARADYPLKVIVSDNSLYSLTTGQTSPTTPLGAKTKSTPLGSPSIPLDPIKLIYSLNPQAFVKSVDAKDITNLAKHFADFFSFPHFALLNIKFDCVSFGKQLKN